MNHRIRSLTVRYGFNVLTAILLGTALWLGFRVYQQSSPFPPAPPPPAGQNPAPAAVPQNRELSEDEKAVLALPKDDADAKRQNYALIERTARRAETVEVSGCLMDPIVPLVSASGEFTLRNRGAVEHVIEVDRNHTVRVPAGGEAKAAGLFSFGPGVYGCACDGTPGCGLFLVTP